MACPFCCDARVQIENGKDGGHLEVHDDAADQANREENRARHFEHFNLAIGE
jgi:hypothetical protein